MLYRHSALAIAAAIMGSALAGAVSLPQAAKAQVYDDVGPRPYALHTQDDGEFDPSRGWADHRRAFDDGPHGPEHFPHHGPAAYDGRDGDVFPYDWRGDRPPIGHGDRRWDRGDDHPGYGARFDHPYGPGLPGSTLRGRPGRGDRSPRGAALGGGSPRPRCRLHDPAERDDDRGRLAQDRHPPDLLSALEHDAKKSARVFR